MAEEKFDAIIVGAGPAGTAAALTLAKAGLEVVLFERGEYPGSKNMMGGILFSSTLHRLIPNFWEEAPIERPVTTKRFTLLGQSSALSFDYQDEEFSKPPFNHNFIVLRAKFDRWFAEKAEAAGVFIIPETVVDDVIVKDNKVVGVKSRREEGDLYADVVIAADGANSLLAKKAGLWKKQNPAHYAVAVKQVLGLSKEEVEKRFGLDEQHGTAIEYFGEVTAGLPGSGFIYTNKNSISIGLGISIYPLMGKKERPVDLLEKFKQHSAVRNLVQDAELLEYSAHLIPEGGYQNIPTLYRDGFIVVGDAAGLVNTSLLHEGSRMAMESGILAAETVIAAKEKGDFSAIALSKYVEKLHSSFLMQDLKKFQNMSSFMEAGEDFFKTYPDLMLKMANQYFSIGEISISEKYKNIWKTFRKDVSWFKLLKDLYKLKKAML